MGFRTTEAEISNYTTDQIYWQLENHGVSLSDLELFFLCDQLLQRKEPIKFIKKHFESLVKTLKVDVLNYIEKFDERFSKAAVHVALRRLKGMGRNLSEWHLVTDEEEQLGPFDRMEVEHRLQSDIVFVWKQGWKEWKETEDVSYLTEELFYDQIFSEGRSQSSASKATPPKAPTLQSSPGNGFGVATGIIFLIGIPLWLVACIALPISSHGSFTGWFAPLVFALFMLALTIPTGIGLLMRRYWAWNVALVSSVILVAWFVYNLVNNSVNGFWTVMGLYQAVILTLLLSGKETFNQQRYENSGI